MRHWLIWSIEHDAWWAPNELGYTRALTEAGLYPQERAAAIVANANRHGNFHECMVPAECVDLEPSTRY